ncbi:uncharacterized protein I206_102393 [Kwoniella pini CBS 10737]|uniref:Protein phosphatase 4 regulatory subunit 1 n=1 Tax=Kwoniella pini CBS 10737 TaxID=1296096 RepID=A0A1B9I590_9TREE|nr:uncharacterized protein I206_02740 [Kwoniella pini CBS 10737]OCF50685.1 hypothetical protein I206_02740 [Kwoniella pini CBS 10737]
MGSASRSGSEGTPTGMEKEGDGKTSTPKQNYSVESDSPPSPYDQSTHSSPPLPPADFNPPADFPIDSPISSISTPSVSSAASPTTYGLFSPSSDSGPSTYTPGDYSHLHRPALQSIQRVSSDSIATPGSGTSSLSSNPSDGGDHLAEMREDLKEKLLQSEVSTPARSRSSSSSMSTTTAENFRFNLINPTPPSEPALFEDYEDDEYNAEAGPSMPRRLSSGALANLDAAGTDMPVEHAWDSVWPAAGSAHRNVHPDLGSSRFPIAPVSPFVTPSFSPAIIPATSSSSSLSRKPPSPTVDPHEPVSPLRRSQSPVTNPFRFSPRSGGNSPNMEPSAHSDNYYGGRRRSVTADSPFSPHSPPSTAPISINLSRHNRSLSNSSQNGSSSRLSFHRGSPTTASPPKSPARPSLSIPYDNGRPTSPSSGRQNYMPGSPLSAPVNRLSNPGASPPISAITKSRPRGHSLSSTIRGHPFSANPPSQSPSADRQSSPSAVASKAENKQDKSTSPFQSSSSLPPFTLPPAVAKPPNPFPEPSQISIASNSARPPSPPLYAPLARPAVLRRALSDYDAKTRNVPPAFHRTLSITAELDKSPKQSTSSAEATSPSESKKGNGFDFNRGTKSPRKSPNVLPVISPQTARSAGPLGDTEQRVGDLAETSDQSYFPDVASQDWSGETATDHVGDIDIVDEGDVLPMGDIQMDVTFDDEGLNTLERIFLLSKSEYPFHRAYVARVLGDLLNEVDPCESVEYVLPLLSGFSMDDDETVKEAFASELHRILWYFFSTCKLLIDDGDGEMTEVSEPPEYGIPREEHPPEHSKETLTITSEGMNAVPTPTIAEATENAIPMGRPRSDSSLLSTSSATGPSSAGSSLTRPPSSKFSPGILEGPEVDTPNSSISASSQDTAFSPGLYIKPYAETGDADVDVSKEEQGALVDRPVLAVNFFTPLVGSLLLNQNPVISESVRNGVVAIMQRLRGKGEISLETWGHVSQQAEADERRGFVTQSGPHQHDLRPFSREARSVVEGELLQGIVIGMGQLSTDMPDMISEDPEQASEDEIRDHEAFQAQLVQEATAGRATSMNLIGAVSEFFEQHELVENGFIEEILASGDGDVPVRAEAAVAISCLAKLIPVEHVYQMIPLFEMFCEDENDHVKQSACLALPALCERIESADYRRSFAVKAVQTLMAGDEDVRCAALEMLGEVIYIFHTDPRGPPDELIDVFTDDSDIRDGESDSDWDIVAIFNFPGVCLTLGSERWPDIRDLFQRLQDRAGEKVLQTTASCLHELTKILRPEQVVSDLLPVYTRLLGDSDEIRERVFEHVDVIIASVPKDVGWSLFRHLARGWKEGMLGGWRAREKLGMHIPSFLETFAGWKGVEEILEMMRDALLDPFAAVRDAVTKGIPKAYEVLGTRSPVAKKFRDILLGLGDSKVFRQRLTFIRCLREFVKPPPNRQAFEDFFLPGLPRLSKDVVDVRLALAQTIADLFVVGAYYSNVGQNVPKTIWEIAYELAQDESTDVRDTVRKVNMDKARPTGKGKDVQVPYEVNVDGIKEDRSLKPGEREMRDTQRQSSGNSFPSVSNTSVASQHQHRKSSSNSGSSSSSSTSTITSNDPKPTGQSPNYNYDRSSPETTNPFSTSSGSSISVRRPSGEINTKMGSGSGSGSGSDDTSSTPRILNDEFKTTFVKSPFSLESIPNKEGDGELENNNPFASSFGKATND